MMRAFKLDFAVSSGSTGGFAEVTFVHLNRRSSRSPIAIAYTHP